MGREATPSIQAMPWPTTPRVSIVIACYDDGATLPMALASLIAQTVQDWEALIIDDGSNPTVAPLVTAFGDRRMHYHGFSKNRGRSVARQKGLELARGEYICILDADDWYYPQKLQWQLEVLEDNPQLLAVSTAMAVIDKSGALTGVRVSDRRPLSVRRCELPEPPEMAFSPVMIRREVALRHPFDPRLRRAEDPDYLMKILHQGLYGVINRPAYAYREEYSPQSMQEAFKAFRYQRMIYARRFGEAPTEAAHQYLRSVLRTGVYGAAELLGQGQWLFERRNRRATDLEARTFARAQSSVTKALNRPRFAYARPVEVKR